MSVVERLQIRVPLQDLHRCDSNTSSAASGRAAVVDMRKADMAVALAVLLASLLEERRQELVGRPGHQVEDMKMAETLGMNLAMQAEVVDRIRRLPVALVVDRIVKDSLAELEVVVHGTRRQQEAAERWAEVDSPHRHGGRPPLNFVDNP